MKSPFFNIHADDALGNFMGRRLGICSLSAQYQSLVSSSYKVNELTVQQVVNAAAVAAHHGQGTCIELSCLAYVLFVLAVDEQSTQNHPNVESISINFDNGSSYFENHCYVVVKEHQDAELNSSNSHVVDFWVSKIMPSIGKIQYRGTAVHTSTIDKAIEELKKHFKKEGIQKDLDLESILTNLEKHGRQQKIKSTLPLLMGIFFISCMIYFLEQAQHRN
ncbi:MAG: hypothetical protein V4591_08565 [Bdellovibrionota bacterium]